MKLNTKHTLDQAMIQRYSDLLEAHPNSHLTVREPDFPDFDKGIPPFNQVLEGKLTHIIRVRGPLLLVSWLPSEQFKELFTQYGTTGEA